MMEAESFDKIQSVLKSYARNEVFGDKFIAEVDFDDVTHDLMVKLNLYKNR